MWLRRSQLSRFALFRWLVWSDNGWKLVHQSRTCLMCLLAVSLAVGREVYAVPIAITDFDADIAVVLKGGGPYINAIPQGVIDLGNGITFLANPNAKVNAGAMSYAVAAVPFVEATRFDPPTGNPDTEAGRKLDLIKATDIVDPVFLKRAQPDRLVKLNSSEGESVSADAASPDVVASTNAHEGRVSLNKLTVRRDPRLKDGGRSLEPQPLGQFDITKATTSKATDNTKLEYSAAAAVSRGQFGAAKIKNLFNALFPVAGSGFDPELELDWNVKRLSVTAVPSLALGIVSHAVEVTLLGPAGADTKLVGFEVRVQDGRVTTVPFDLAGDTTVADWLKANLEVFPVGTGLKPGASNLVIDIPIELGFRATNGATMDIIAESLNYHISFEQPPVANGKKGADAGGMPDSSSGSLPNLHWDALSQMLTFDPIPVTQLSGGSTLGIAPRFADDRISSSVLEVSPVKRLTTVDGQDFFSEGEVRLVDGTGVLFSAEFPAIFLDESLFGATGFNLFASLMDFQIGEGIDSLWIDEYLAQGVSTSGLVPELFIGLDGLLEDFGGGSSFETSQSFDAYANVIIAASANIPEPPTLLLTLIGLAVIALTLHRD